MINFGNLPIKEVYVGENKVSKIYFGNILVYEEDTQIEDPEDIIKPPVIPDNPNDNLSITPSTSSVRFAVSGGSETITLDTTIPDSKINYSIDGDWITIIKESEYNYAISARRNLGENKSGSVTFYYTLDSSVDCSISITQSGSLLPPTEL